jgi:hypothetical protein
MSARDSIRDLLHRDPFEPFRIVMSSGESVTIRSPDLVVVMRSEVFIAEPNSDRRSYVPLLHVARVATIANGRRNGHPRRGRRKRRQ